ncbi:hypothetical protein I6N96_04000 [Enterococcus sp. BWM-S5]|uniref:Uncharacterized protein n=1 Tax=Enterococcus larvae TaxID=2794352 RepID=A0ABS4CHK1_9ENTE|nr:hypothetical protein [Enterococcus larvae]MBP1045427.1 hypothetical protein [Enterococcus larvae]
MGRSYESQLKYIEQEEVKIKDRIQKVYGKHSNSDWRLEDVDYYKKKTACDYPDCRHGSVKNGINNVCMVINVRTDERLNLGTRCYFKFLFGISDLSECQKKAANHLVKTIKREKIAMANLSKEKEITIDEIFQKLEGMRKKLASIGIFMSDGLYKTIEEDSDLEMLRLAKILDNSIEKYNVEIDKLKEKDDKRMETNRQNHEANEADNRKRNYSEQLVNNSLDNFWKVHKENNGIRNWKRR